MSSWADLAREIAFWQTQGLRLPLWWRDDDAIAPTPQLSRLVQASQTAGIPVHLAIIPARATVELAGFVAQNSKHLIPVVHGWAHENHAPPEAKRSEFGTLRPEAAMEAGRGHARLRALFGAQLAPVFVPPWNRIDPVLLPRLPAQGFKAVSTYGPRHVVWPAPGLQQVNTHLDPVDWHGTRSLVDEDILLAGLCKTLADRRTRRTDPTEPLGLLTHHLIHDEDVWAFCARIFEALAPITEPVPDLLGLAP